MIFFILVNLYISALTNFRLVEGFKGQVDYKNKLFILNITSCLLLLGLNSFFLEEKKADYYFVLNRNIYKREKIENLNNEVIRLKQSLKEDLLTEENLHELIEAIQLNDLVFLKKFEKIFPDFFDKITHLTTATLIISDLKFCAMLKLGLTTKEIAIYTNSTIKSVEGKIYRLRKKLKISPDIDSKSWFLNI
ncbi:helix-turn-helix transcriptional regulator [Chryseobacterium sp. CT-SW4]|uniref:helix-turn-helix transcriptional regulator n=1 Tax=Chryseobacterium sp. SW-1 TaxID=3157343 RepID=UPI003B0170C6